MTQASSSSDVAALPSPYARPNISYMSIRRKSRFYLTFQALHSKALITPVCSCIPLYSLYTRNLSVNHAEADPRRGLPPSNRYDSHKAQTVTPYPHSIIPSPRMAINKTPKLGPLSRFKDLPSLDLSDEEDDDADG